MYSFKMKEFKLFLNVVVFFLLYIEFYHLPSVKTNKHLNKKHVMTENYQDILCFF